jgi:hypothetical protein
MSGCRRKYLDKCLRGGARLNEFVWRFQRPRRARKNQVRTSVLSSASEAAASAKPSKGGKRSRTGPSQSPSDQRCAKRESLWLVASRSLCTRCCETERSSYRPKPAIHETGGRIQLPRGATPEGGSRRRRGFCCMRPTLADCGFNLAALHPAYPIKCRTSTQRTQAS